MLSNIEASDTEATELRKVKGSLFYIRIEKCKKTGFLIPWYLK